MEEKTMNLPAVPPDNIPDVLIEVQGQVGFVTLNRPKALNALSLNMIRQLQSCLLTWRDDPLIQAVAIRGQSKTGPFGTFCAGGDIRFFHQAALADDPELGKFFTEEYNLNHLIHSYPKPYIAFLDGIVMGGGMGLCGHGKQTRIVTEHTRMAMPETGIGLFPDVGGGYFLSRCPGYVGEWLALTGAPFGASQALAFGLADACVTAEQLQRAWAALAHIDMSQANAISRWMAQFSSAPPEYLSPHRIQIDHFFSKSTVTEIVQALEADDNAWAQQTATTLRRHSPLMLHVALAQVRRARHMTLAEDLRMERDMVAHCFAPRHLGRDARQSETVEGIRALVIDKDRSPHWHPARIEDVTQAMVTPFFVSPWTPQAHPLHALA
ncbi:MAG: enoyl-CoA hydratase/carnithine racemase [Rhodoferax sp.]|jgi:enoyl-CoA hydratase/carnithine racemase